VLKQTGLFEYLAIWAAKRARGRPFAIMAMLCTITAVASALLPNVTTVMLVAPVTLLVCDRLRIRPEGFLIALVMASNIGGTATLIGDPPNRGEDDHCCGDSGDRRGKSPVVKEPDCGQARTVSKKARPGRVPEGDEMTAAVRPGP
jgi:hypothetical protein